MSINLPNGSFQTTEVTAGANYIVGFDVAISQTEVPYILPSTGTLPNSETDLYVYGDTVTITGDLLNPGRTIAIYARQIIASPNTFINVAGGDAAESYPAGQAQPPSTQPGANGATGADGSQGSTGGQIIVAAGTLIVQGSDTGAGTPERTVSLSQILALAISEGLANYCTTAPTSTTASDWSTSWPPGASTGTLTLSAIAVGGMNLLPVTTLTAGSAGQYTLTLKFNSPTLTSSYSIEYPNDPSQNLSGSCNGSFSAQVIVNIAIGPAQSQITCRAGGINISQMDVSSGHVTIDVAVDSVFGSYLQGELASIPASIGNAIAARYLPTQTSNGTPAIMLLVQGGVGGRGEDGQPGAQGTAGSAGLNDPASQAIMGGSENPPGVGGGTGGIGGTGGNAGTSGSGGTGGSIQLLLQSALGSGPCVALVGDGGVGGPAANPGAPGTGGSAGTAGSFYIDWGNGPQFTYGPPGKPGSPGGVATFQGAVGSPGSTGAVSDKLPSKTFIVEAMPLQLLTYSQLGAKLAYLNAQSTSDYQNVIAIYTWLLTLTVPFSGTPPPAGFNTYDVQTRAAVCQSAVNEMSHLTTGLDYYGNPCNWAPVLSWQWLSQRINQQILLYNTIQTAVQSATSDSGQASATAAQINNDLQNLDAQVTTLNAQAQQLSASVATLNQQISQQQAKFTADLTETEQEYIATQGGQGCTFDNMLTIATGIVQLGSSAMLGVGDLTAAIGAEQGGTYLISGVKDLVVGMAPATGAGSAALASAWDSIQSTLSQWGANSALVAVEDTQFQQNLESYYSGLPQQYYATVEDDVNTLISLIQTRNQALLNFTSIYTQMQRVQTQIQQKQSELEYIAALVVGQAPAPQVPVFISFVQSSLAQIATEIADNLYFANQAYNYWAVSANPFVLNGLDIASLSENADQLIQNVQDYITGTGVPFQSFQDMSIVVTKAEYPSAFADLATSKLLTITLPNSPNGPFAGTYNVTVDSMMISFPDVTPPPGNSQNPTVLYVSITQSGPDQRQDVNGNILSFTHTPRASIIYEFNFTTNQQTVDGTVGDPSQGFNGLSPFAMWTLDFSGEQNSWLDLTTLDEVEITFTGTLLGDAQVSKVA